MRTLKIIAMALWLGFLCALMFLSTKAQAQDTWTGSDKKMHAGVSMLIGFGARHQWPNEPMKAFGVALIPGIVKEATDDKASAKDMVANAIGAAVGVYTGGLFITYAEGKTTIHYRTDF